MLFEKAKYNEQEQMQFYKAAANIFEGFLTKKTYGTRTNDKEGDFDNEIVRATFKYIDKNFDKLQNLDEKTLKFIGKSLKLAHKSLPSDPSARKIFEKFDYIILDDEIAKARIASENIIQIIANSMHKKATKGLELVEPNKNKAKSR